MTALTVSRIGSTTWQYDWTAGSAPYTVYFHGLPVTSGTATTYSMDFSDATWPPDIEVVDASETCQQALYPGRLLLQWQRVDGAIGYRVEQYLDSAWTRVARLGQVDTSEYIHLTSRWLDDSADAAFRVYAVDQYENLSAALEITHMIVRHPDSPAVELANTAGTVTVA